MFSGKEVTMDLRECTRREFVKSAAIGAAATAMSGTFMSHSFATGKEKVDIGQCKSLRILCISETSWFDNGRLMEDIKNAGGPSANQYEIKWSKKNSGGYSALVEVEALDGTHSRFLLDTGWNKAWMEYSFQREGIDEMLGKGEIEFLYLSHEHMDHFWGLAVVTKYNPKIPLYISDHYYPEGKALIGASGHRGEIRELPAGKVHVLFPGCASVTFDIPILIRVRGEQALFFNVKGKGIVTVTGCCHMGVIQLMRFAQENLVGGERLYGLYGGLHIAPFEQWDPKLDELVDSMSKLGLKKVAANHCTGLVTIEKMRSAGIPVVQGSAKYGSKSPLYVGNGDEVTFG